MSSECLESNIQHLCEVFCTRICPKNLLPPPQNLKLSLLLSLSLVFLYLPYTVNSTKLIYISVRKLQMSYLVKSPLLSIFNWIFFLIHALSLSLSLSLCKGRFRNLNGDTSLPNPTCTLPVAPGTSIMIQASAEIY